MDRVEEIKAAIASLPPEDYQRIVDWLVLRERDQWDEQMDADSSSGRLDFLVKEAELGAYRSTCVTEDSSASTS